MPSLWTMSPAWLFGIALGACAAPREVGAPPAQGVPSAQPPSRPGAGAYFGPVPAGARAFSLAVTAEMLGTVEPCGCTTDPLGDLARTAKLLEGNDVVWVDGGEMTWPRDREPRKRFQQELRAALLADVARARGLAITRSPDRGSLALPGEDRVVVAGGVQVGVLVAGADPAAQARALREKGAEVVVALLGERRAARRLLGRVPGIDIGVVGAKVGEGDPIAERVEDAILVQPADQGRRVGLLRVVLRPGAPPRLEDAGGLGKRRARLAHLERQIAALEARLAGWSTQKDADASFVAERRRELERARAERSHLVDPRAPDRAVPARGSYFEYALVDIRRKLPRDAAIAARMREIDRQVSRENLEAARREPAPPLPKDATTFVGGETCGKAGCHVKELAFWQKTVHAHAWQTLVELDKQYDYDCIGCHVTGYGKPGGASLARHAPLVSVQCETCHGPGSRHVAGEGLEEPPAIVRAPAEDLCASQCHTAEHSDTFERKAYLRDILGEGHAPRARAALGAGPTGQGLRAAAIARAKAAR